MYLCISVVFQAYVHKPCSYAYVRMCGKFRVILLTVRSVFGAMRDTDCVLVCLCHCCVGVLSGVTCGLTYLQYVFNEDTYVCTYVLYVLAKVPFLILHMNDGNCVFCWILHTHLLVMSMFVCKDTYSICSRVAMPELIPCLHPQGLPPLLHCLCHPPHSPHLLLK